jgi:transcriptional regulator GlxA family with amidase domain
MSSRFDQDDWKAYAAQCGYSITRMAKGKNMSRQHFRRCFLQALGATPKECIDLERLKVAMRLLTEGKSVKEVAIALGFPYCSDFDRFFLRMAGLSPRSFLQMFPKANKNPPNVP